MKYYDMKAVCDWLIKNDCADSAEFMVDLSEVMTVASRSASEHAEESDMIIDAFDFVGLEADYEPGSSRITICPRLEITFVNKDENEDVLDAIKRNLVCRLPNIAELDEQFKVLND